MPPLGRFVVIFPGLESFLIVVLIAPRPLPRLPNNVRIVGDVVVWLVTAKNCLFAKRKGSEIRVWLTGSQGVFVVCCHFYADSRPPLPTGIVGGRENSKTNEPLAF